MTRARSQIGNRLGFIIKMINKELLQRAHSEEIIDKRQVLWWQLGYEERKIYSEDEFNENLVEVSYDCVNFSNDKVSKRTFKVWPKEDIPIMIKKVKIGDVDIPCFVTIRPMSDGDGWNNLNVQKEQKMPLTAYREPHIRGAVIEITNKFLFYHNISLGAEPSYYGGAQGVKFDGEEILCLVNPIHPNKFYKNLIRNRGSSNGRIAQRRFNEIDCNEKGVEMILRL